MDGFCSDGEIKGMLQGCYLLAVDLPKYATGGLLLVLMNLLPDISQVIGIAEGDECDEEEGNKGPHGESEVSRSDFAAWNNHDGKQSASGARRVRWVEWSDTASRAME